MAHAVSFAQIAKLKTDTPNKIDKTEVVGEQGKAV